MKETLADDCPCKTTIVKWCFEFKSGRTSVQDEARGSPPKSATTQEKIEAVRKIVENDRRVTIRNIAETVGISSGVVHQILHRELHMHKLSARWVPRMLTATQKRTRLQVSSQNLARLRADRSDFIGRLVTQDETWIHHFDPETKQQSKQWVRCGSPPLTKFKRTSSAQKVMASVFWNSEGVIMIDYLERGHTVTGDYYAQELKQLRETIKKNRRGKLRSGVVMSQDNAPCHTCRVAMAAAKECGFEILPHPPYSPDLAPSDYYLFPKLKSVLRGKRFETNNDVIEAVDAFLRVQKFSFFYEGIAKLEDRWNKCVMAEGEYFEKS